MIPMFPFSVNNTLKLFANSHSESIDEDLIKEKISQAIVQSFPTKRNIKFNAIIVLECDSEQKRSIVINETISSNNQNVQFTFPGSSFTTISASDVTNPSNVIFSKQPIFPATIEGLQTILNMTSSSMNHNNFSFIPMSTNIKLETNNNEASCPSRKRKSEKPCRIPQSPQAESRGLDLTLGAKSEEEVRPFQAHGVPIWPCPIGTANRAVLAAPPRPRKVPPSQPGQKKSSKVFNCNQCKLQFTSLNALCKHTFSDHRAFRCTFCSANFTQRSNLQRHSLKHVGFKPFICNVCGKAYYRKDHLVRHIEVSHPGSDPKANITVKLSSSECLEYLEKMQSNKLAEMAESTEMVTLEDGNHFLTAVDMGPLDGSPATLPPYDYTRDTPPLDSPEKLHISPMQLFVKEECREFDGVLSDPVSMREVHSDL